MITKTIQGCVTVKCLGMLTAIAIAGSFGSIDFLSPSHASGSVPEAFTRGFSDIVEKVQPAVVNVAVSGRDASGPRRLPPGPFGGPPGGGPPGGGGPPMPGPPGGRPPGPPGMSAGSGVLISPEGYIVTNNHVVEDASKIIVTLFSGEEFPGKIIGTDPKTDLAVIKIEGANLPFVSWSKDETLKVGNLVLAVGSPFGLKSSVTMGIISALGRGNVGITEYEDFIQTDAPINPGNSGGPLINMNGEIVGINTAIFSRTGGSEGIGFAIPVDIVKDIATSLMQSGRVVRGWMGIAIQEMTPALAQSFQLPDTHTGGVLISEVHENGPSAKGGLLRGDVILEYRGEKLKDVNHLRHIVARTRVGDDVPIIVLRNGAATTLTVQVGERPSDDLLAQNGGSTPPPEMEKLDNVLSGLTVESLTPELKGQLKLSEQTAGVVVKEVKAGSAAETAGLQQGDVIQEINREIVGSLSDFQSIASKIEKESLVVLLLSRRGNNLFVAVNPK
ncbi:MAG: Do family serine endopeptidase [Nitrospirae bacterium]|nr:Do family serine endopeptidase [Nitrospirota bacterium]MDA1303783.1 Do family serine endopeptidase [Nitrospirota bacterium]